VRQTRLGAGAGKADYGLVEANLLPAATRVAERRK